MNTIVWVTGFYHGVFYKDPLCVPLQFHSHIQIWSPLFKKTKKNKMVSAKKVEKKDSTPIRDITVAMSTSYI